MYQDSCLTELSGGKRLMVSDQRAQQFTGGGTRNDCLGIPSCCTNHRTVRRKSAPPYTKLMVLEPPNYLTNMWRMSLNR